MKIPALLPGQGPLLEAQVTQFNRLVGTLDSEQAAWLLGYLAATHRVRGGGSPAEGAQASRGKQMTVLYASQTGNGARVAKQLVLAAARAGVPAVAVGAADYRTSNLRAEEYLAVIASTHGDGEPPEPATELHRFLFGKRAPRLERLRFAVLALGDESYAQFCKAGADFDRRLAELGAERVLPRVDCDVDYLARAAAWQESIVSTFKQWLSPQGLAPMVSVTPEARDEAVEYTREQPFCAPVLERINLNGRGSLKQTVHLELSLTGSGLTHQAGDALAVLPRNDPDYVADLLAALRLAADEPVQVDGNERRLVDVLTDSFEITTITPSFLRSYATLASQPALANLAGHGQEESFCDYASGREIIDVVAEYPARGLTGQSLVGILRRLQPRLYSIASSTLAHPEEVHLLVKLVRYQAHGRTRTGVASGFLCERLDEEASVPVYLSPNSSFRLPPDRDARVIMIGPGTGVAPFRAFVEERESLGCRGPAWLFFGDQHLVSDFLYQTEWQRWHKSGVLSRIDVAFSRDQAEKLYVQHRMLERSRDLYAWLQEGAHVYVCGEGRRMAADVHDALVTIVSEQGDRDREGAVAYLDDLSAQRRYQRDVY
jgi:sulfite reductase (NADPH) flavoprotein alpha-component